MIDDHDTSLEFVHILYDLIDTHILRILYVFSSVFSDSVAYNNIHWYYDFEWSACKTFKSRKIGEYPVLQVYRGTLKDIQMAVAIVRKTSHLLQVLTLFIIAFPVFVNLIVHQ